MNEEYWNNYYTRYTEPFEPSSFSRFALQYMNKAEKLIDLGCGNCRDSVFFSKNDINVIAIDKSESTQAICADVTKLRNINTTHSYARFLLHCLTDEEENDLLRWVKRNTKKYLFIETRSDAGNRLPSTHYRRYINMNKLLSKLIYFNFKIKYCKESNGLSIYDSKFGADENKQDIDPILIRVVAQA